MDFDQFCEHYKKYGKCPHQLSKPLHTLNEKELLSKWKSYSKAKVKSSQKVSKGVAGDPLWDEVSDIVWKRDKECRLLSKLKIDKFEDYKYFISSNPYSLIQKLDLAHIISRSASKNLYYDPDNIILLSRPAHSLLDSYHDPIYGKAITKDEREDWFRYIVGNEKYEKLLEKI